MVAGHRLYGGFDDDAVRISPRSVLLAGAIDKLDGWMAALPRAGALIEPLRRSLALLAVRAP